MRFLFQLFLFIVFINLANGKVFYIDDGEAQTIPVNLNNDRLNRLQAQILSLLGLRRPTSETETPDEVASRYMSSLYRSIEHRESVEFSPSFKYLENESKNLPFDFERISDWHTADTIISFVPKRIRILESGVETDINELEFDLSSDDVNAD
uniref:TGF-beta propeptide domain-containing protein n=1 Tax=Acrobeloides nanus TaxID=290746 RepID=A0A914CRA7_9BILA